MEKIDLAIEHAAREGYSFVSMNCDILTADNRNRAMRELEHFGFKAGLEYYSGGYHIGVKW
jgi:hypothetical protein